MNKYFPLPREQKHIDNKGNLTCRFEESMLNF